MKRALFIIRIFVLIALPIGGVALAQDLTPTTCNPGKILPSCTCYGTCGLSDFIAMFVNLSYFFMGFAGFLAVFYLVNGSFTLIISSGSADRIKAGKAMILGAIIGIIIVFSAWAVINSLYGMLTGGGIGPNGEWFRLKDPSAVNTVVPAPHYGMSTTFFPHRTS